MRIANDVFGLILLCTVVGCGGAGVDAKSANDAGRSECDVIASQLQAVDDSIKDVHGPAIPRALVPALEKLSQDLKGDEIKSPELKAAADDLASEASLVSSKIKEIIPVVDELEKVAKSLEAWQQKVEKVSADYDAACAKGPKSDCDMLDKSFSSIPQLEGDKFAEYADQLEKFLDVQAKVNPSDAKIKTAFTNVCNTMREALAPMRRMSALALEADKADEASQNLKPKANKVRQLCNLPQK